MRTTNLVIALILLNAAAGFLVASGWTADAGVSPEPGGDEHVSNVTNESNDVRASGGNLGTLFGLFQTVTGGFQDMLSIVFAGPLLLANLGVPNWILGFVFAPLYFIVAVDIIYLLVGRRID